LPVGYLQKVFEENAMIILYADGCMYVIDARAIYVPPFWRE